MSLTLSDTERAARAEAVAHERRVRRRRRYQWRRMKGVAGANRAYADVDERAAQAVEWRDNRSPADLLRIAGPHSSKFGWLPI